MADYEGHSRSNYFKVRDNAAFLAYCDKYNLKPISHGLDSGLVGFLGQEMGGWEHHLLNPETGEDLPGDLESDLYPLLQEGEVAILMHAGHEGGRYCSGYAVAINSKGKTKKIFLSDIYDLAKKLTKRPDDITPAEY